MRLSEAIRLGAMLKPQAFGGPADAPLQQQAATCALAAAAEALGLRMLNIFWKSWPWMWVNDFDRQRVCPVCTSDQCHPAGVIVHLNDVHRWTREQIANFVETFEPAPALDAVDPHGVSSTGTPTPRV